MLNSIKFEDKTTVEIDRNNNNDENQDETQNETQEQVK